MSSVCHKVGIRNLMISKCEKQLMKSPAINKEFILDIIKLNCMAFRCKINNAVNGIHKQSNSPEKAHKRWKFFVMQKAASKLIWQ